MSALDILVRGDDRTQPVTLPAALGDLSAAAFQFSAREQNGALLFTRRNAAAGGSAAEIAVTVAGPPTQIEVYITPANTSALALPAGSATTLRCDLQVTTVAGRVVTVWTGTMQVEGDATVNTATVGVSPSQGDETVQGKLSIVDDADDDVPSLSVVRTDGDGGDNPTLFLDNYSNDLAADPLISTRDGSSVASIVRKYQDANGILEMGWGLVGKANAHYGNISILRNTLVENDQPFFRLVPGWTLGGTNIDLKGESDGANYDRFRLLFGRDTDRTLQVTCPDATPGYMRLGKLGLDMHPDQTYTRALFRLRYDVDEVMELKRHENYAGSGLYHSSAAFTSTLTTNQTAWYLPINTGRSFLVTARVVARKSDGTARAAYVLHCAVHGEGAGAVITAQSAALTAESDGTWECAFTTSGDNLVLAVHGNNGIAETVYWVIGLEYHSVASAA